MEARALGFPLILPSIGVVPSALAGAGRNFQVIIIRIVSARIANALFTMKAVDLKSAFLILTQWPPYGPLDYGQYMHFEG